MVGSWPGAWVSRSGGKHGASSFGSHLYGTAKAQRFIWAHQHPRNCTAAKFLLYPPIPSGIGSILHHMGQVGAMPGHAHMSVVQCML